MGIADWRNPAAGGTVANNITRNFVWKAGAYWFAQSSDTTDNDYAFRVATNPSGAWTTVSLPAPPVGYTNSGLAPIMSGVGYDGSTYALAVVYANGALRKSRVVYATDPTGTWSAYEFDATDLYIPAFFGYLNGQWVMAGKYATASPQPAFIATASTASGTYTFNTSAATTGYDTAALTGTGTRYWEINSLDFDGTTWVSSADQNTGTSGVRYSTSLTSGWATPSSSPSVDFTGRGVVRYQGGWWTINGSSNNAYYTATPSGTWTILTEVDTGLGSLFWQLVYGDGYWVAVGAYDNAGDPHPRISYLRSESGPSGTYTVVGDGGFNEAAFGGSFLSGLAYADGYFVGANNNYSGELRWSNVGAPTILRQRQSSKRTPSRVRMPDLRQRQTPFIT